VNGTTPPLARIRGAGPHVFKFRMLTVVDFNRRQAPLATENLAHDSGDARTSASLLGIPQAFLKSFGDKNAAIDGRETPRKSQTFRLGPCAKPRQSDDA